MDSARSPTRALDRRELRAIGRTARLELVFGCRKGRTVRSYAYAEPPFRVGRSFSDGSGVHMILASSAPGIFGGDDFEQHIRVERGARVRLTSQSALQVHPAGSPAGEHARLRSTYEVESGGVLSCRWDPLIPFAGARLDQRIVITLAPGAALSWSDAFMAGREGKGERWAFESLAHELRVARGGELEYLERYQVAGADTSLRSAWIAADACYFGTIISSGPLADDADAERLHRELEAVGDVRAAADVLGARLLLVRLMAARGVAFHDARERVRRATGFGKPP